MSETRRQLLQMLQDGKITADQAAELLAALEPAETAATETAVSPPEEVLTGEIIQPASLPDMGRWRRFWQIPFFVALGVLIATAFWLRAIYQSAEGAITLGFVCVWTLFMVALGLTFLAFMSRRSAWLHVRIQERGGTRFALSLPLPLGLASWGLRIAQVFTPASKRNKLHLAAELVTAARDGLAEPGAEPIVIQVNDNDGDQVQVYIG